MIYKLQRKLAGDLRAVTLHEGEKQQCEDLLAYFRKDDVGNADRYFVKEFKVKSGNFENELAKLRAIEHKAQLRQAQRDAEQKKWEKQMFKMPIMQIAAN